MHVLVAAPTTPRSGVTSAVMRGVMDFCFADPRVERVVVEPDVRNAAIARKNAEVGFVEDRQISLRDKVARLNFCTRAAYEMSTPHLNPAAIEYAHRRLIAKALAEFRHERLIAFEEEGDGYRFGEITFRARKFAMEHWVVDPESLRGPLDALDFITGLRKIPDKLLGTYLEEISATLAGAGWKHHHRRETAEELAHADFQTIEAAMTEGHPGSPTCSTGSCGTSPGSWTATGRCLTGSSGGWSATACAGTRPITRRWPGGSTSSGPPSGTPASTGCHCATRCRWWTSPTRPARSSSPVSWTTRSPGSRGRFTSDLFDQVALLFTRRRGAPIGGA
jgi:hypothetical protein